MEPPKATGQSSARIELKLNTFPSRSFFFVNQSSIKHRLGYTLSVRITHASSLQLHNPPP